MSANCEEYRRTEGKKAGWRAFYYLRQGFVILNSVQDLATVKADRFRIKFGMAKNNMP